MGISRRTPILALMLTLLIGGCQSNDENAADPGEITAETPLLNPDGTLAARGWARGPLMQYDRSLVRADQADGLREWEYYAVFTPDFAIGLTLADLGLLSAQDERT